MTTQQLESFKRTKAVLVSQGFSTTEVDAKIAALEAEAARNHNRKQAVAGYDFAVEVEGATEETIKERAVSEGPFVEPSTPGTYEGEIWKIELVKDVQYKPWPMFKFAWRSTDQQEKAARGSLFCEMKDNAEWVLTRCVLENLGIPYEVKGNVVLFNDFTREGPLPAKARWEETRQGKAKIKIAEFFPIDHISEESTI